MKRDTIDRAVGDSDADVNEKVSKDGDKEEGKDGGGSSNVLLSISFDQKDKDKGRKELR